MRKILFLFLVVLMGCAKLQHLQELLTLKHYSDSQEQTEKFIEGQDQKFNNLCKVVQENRLFDYPDEKSILKNFGEPVLITPVVKDRRSLSQWLYRHCISKVPSDKIYLYFDDQKKLVDWERIPFDQKTQVKQ